MVEDVCVLISTELVGVELTVTDVKGWLEIVVVPVLLRTFVEDGDVLATVLDVDDDDWEEVDESEVCVTEELKILVVAEVTGEVLVIVEDVVGWVDAVGAVDTIDWMDVVAVSFSSKSKWIYFWILSFDLSFIRTRVIFTC